MLWESRWRSQGQRYTPSPQNWSKTITEKSLVLKQRCKAKKRQLHPFLRPFDCQRPCQILHSCSCRSWEERKVFPMLVIFAFGRTAFYSPLLGKSLLPFHPWAFSILPLTCVSHHGEASEHISNDVHNHASMFRHVLLVRYKKESVQNIYILQQTFSRHEVGTSQISLNDSIPALNGIFHWVLWQFKPTFSVISAAGHGNCPAQVI